LAARAGPAARPFTGADLAGRKIDPEQAADLFNLFGGAGGLGEIFGRQARGRRSRRPEPAQEIETDVSIPFLTAATGGKVSLSIGDRELDVKIPAGVEDGQTLRLAGQAPGGGDLRLRLRIQPHPFFRREGKNIILEAPLSVPEAVLGTKLDVPTLEGDRLTVKVPSGTSSGARLRLRGKGIKGGDQYIEIKVVVPAPKDARSRELIEEFGRLNPQNPRAGLPWS
jgi:curved DNA-binding protein